MVRRALVLPALRVVLQRCSPALPPTHTPVTPRPCAAAAPQVFGNSPDETAYARIMLNREPAAEGMLMLQPTLYSFSFAGPPEPVLLDVTSIAPDR